MMQEIKDVNIREMKADDITRVLEIENSCFNTPWTRASFERESEDVCYARYLSAFLERKLIGYIGGWLILDELHITNLAVKKDYRRRGIASRLLVRLEELARKQGSKHVLLEVRESNKAARELYVDHGFSQEGLRENYYQDNRENALLMRKELADGEQRKGE